MSDNPPALTAQFVPLVPPVSSIKEPGFASLRLKALPQAIATPGFESLVAAPADQSGSPEVCFKPTVTLQRKGDAVTGIRIQCECGKVIELTCVH